MVDRIDPQAGIALQAERTRQEGFGDLFLEITHLLATGLETLLIFELHRADLDELVDDGGGQELLFSTKGAQDLAADGIGEAQVALARRDPARRHGRCGTSRNKGFFS